MSNHGMSRVEKRDAKRKLWEKSQLCGICGKQLPSRKASTIDHIIPYSRGGGHEIENLQLAHNKCNNKKDNKVG